MSNPEFDIRYVSHLARLALSPDEEQTLGAQLSQILGYVQKLEEVETSQIEPTAHAVPMLNVTRPDEPRPSLPHAEAMRSAPAQANGLFIVPKIVE